MNGVGCKRNKKQAAKYYRYYYPSMSEAHHHSIGEKGGNKIVGNSWIWKDKYD